MSPLDLVPALTDMNRAAIEEHIAGVQARRTAAAIQYYEGKNAKLNARSVVLQRRIRQAYDQLGKELVSCDKAIERVEKRLNAIAELENQSGLVTDQITIIGSDDAMGEDE